MIQGTLVALLFVSAVARIGKRIMDQMNHKKSPGCEKCGQPDPSKR